MINTKNFDPNLLKIDKKSYKNIDIYYIGYITMKHSDYVKIDELDGSTEERTKNKDLSLASTDKNKEVLPKYTELCDGIKNLIEKGNNKSAKYGKDFMKIKFNSDDNLPLNETLKLHNMTKVIRSVFQEDGKYYPQVFFR